MNGAGTVFKIDNAGNFTTLSSFYVSDGNAPVAAPIRDGSGNLFGTTARGGANFVGTVFKLDPGGTFTTLHSFNVADGALPAGTLVQDGAGNLYGTTSSDGGPGNSGTVFKVDPSNTLTTLHRFTGLDGAGPEAGLIFDNSGSGSLWGTTFSGGASGNGVVFRLDPSGTLTDFGIADGAEPACRVVQDAAGNIYGTTVLTVNVDNGTIFKIDTSGNATTLHHFQGPDGLQPFAGVIFDGTGNLYGTTVAGGANNVGTIFKLDTYGTLTTLYSFSGSDGSTPYGGIVQDAAGNLYGTTLLGGDNNEGTLFKLDTSGTLTTLHSFNGAGGSFPYAGLTRDDSGNFYGATEQGGHGGTGVVFLFNAATAPLTVSSITPTSGPAGIGTPVDVRGTGFLEGVSLSIGGFAAEGVIDVDSNELQGITPALLPGTLNDVWVTNPGTPTAILVKGWFADFLDVPQSSPFHADVETIFRLGITAGCGGPNYCPTSPVTRAQMAVFVLKAQHGSGYVPPACTGIFGDVPCPSQYADWIEQLANEGVTGGCGGGNYCPGNPVTRAQMAVFLLKAEHGSGYVPPTCTGIFGDVPCPSLFANWIEQLYAEGVTGGCQTSPLLYCPGNAVTRGQMAVFLVKTFGLE
jgi:uncharacterized repeat protein (TIGR03803 family)